MCTLEVSSSIPEHSRARRLLQRLRVHLAVLAQEEEHVHRHRLRLHLLRLLLVRRRALERGERHVANLALIGERERVPNRGDGGRDVEHAHRVVGAEEREEVVGERREDCLCILCAIVYMRII